MRVTVPASHRATVPASHKVTVRASHRSNLSTDFDPFTWLSVLEWPAPLDERGILSQLMATVRTMSVSDFPHIGIRELSRGPGDVLDRVGRGERFVVCRRGRPVATLQPLDGVVVQLSPARSSTSRALPWGIRKDQRGLVLTGRGMMLREALLARIDAADRWTWRTIHKPGRRSV